MDHSRNEASVDVQATPEQVWDALTNPEKTRGYYYGTDIAVTSHVGDHAARR